MSLYTRPCSVPILAAPRHSLLYPYNRCSYNRHYLSFFLSLYLFCLLIVGVVCCCCTLSHTWTHTHTHTHTRLAGLLGTRDHAIAETSTRQHTKLTRDRHPFPQGSSNAKFQRASGCGQPVDRGETGVGIDRICQV